MAGTSPFGGFQQSPSFQSSSYLPKLEANFMRDFTCCGKTLPNLHDLLQHYEEAHAQEPNHPSSKTPNLMQYGHVPGYGAPNNFGQSSVNSPLGPAGSLAQQGRQPLGIGGSISTAGLQMSPHGLSNVTNQSHLADEMDTVGDMEMDDAVGHLEMDDTQQRSMQQARQLFGQASRPQLNINASGFTQGLRTSQPTTPAAASFGFQHNPTVSSVNTPTLTTQQPLPSRSNTSFNQSPTGDGEDLGMQLGGSINLNGNDFSLGTTSSNTTSNDSAFCINDPGKHLFSPNGAATNHQRALQQQLAQLVLEQNQPLTNKELMERFGPLLMQQEEAKPFRCPVIGCEKAYKNQNGLKYVFFFFNPSYNLPSSSRLLRRKGFNPAEFVMLTTVHRYHKAHGHANQQLHENEDGTFSIVDPDTCIPYPGTLGMEKEKPYSCEVCNKRYKNLNGLKYVRLPSLLPISLSTLC